MTKCRVLANLPGKHKCQVCGDFVMSVRVIEWLLMPGFTVCTCMCYNCSCNLLLHSEGDPRE